MLVDPLITGLSEGRRDNLVRGNPINGQSRGEPSAGNCCLAVVTRGKVSGSPVFCGIGLS